MSVDYGFLHKSTSEKNFAIGKPQIPRKELAAAAIILVIGLSVLIALPILQNRNDTPSVQWQKVLPGVVGNSIIQTTDGGFLALGTNASVQPNSNGDGEFVNQQPILSKLDNAGNVIWTKTYTAGNSNITLEMKSIIATKDGGYALGGTATINTTQPGFSSSYTTQNCVIKLDSSGDFEWISYTPSYDNVYTDANGGRFDGFIQTSDSGYALVSDFTHTMYIHETWYVKIDSSGKLEFNKTMSSNPAATYPVLYMNRGDGSLMLGSYPGRGGSGGVYGIVALDADANIVWSKAYGNPTGNPYATCGAQTNDGGYIVGGYVQDSGWVVKTDALGRMIWNATYFYPNASEIRSVVQAQDGGYVFVGSATSNPSVFSPATRFYTWIFMTDGNGKLLGQSVIDMGNHPVHPTSLVQTKDGGFAFAGALNESFFASPAQKFWFVKIARINAVSPSIWLWAELSVELALIAAEVAVAAVYFLSRRKNVNPIVL